MKTLLDRFDKKSPHYPTIYRESILDRFSRKGGGTEEEKFSQGKYFANYYECFLYAALLGIKNNYSLPFNRANDGTKFLEVEYWKPRKLTIYVFTCLLTISDIEFISLEEMTEEQIDQKAFELINLLEQYANGGFDFIKSKLAENPNYFESPFSAINFLKEQKQ